MIISDIDMTADYNTIYADTDMTATTGPDYNTIYIHPKALSIYDVDNFDEQPEPKKEKYHFKIDKMEKFQRRKRNKKVLI